MLPGDHPDLAVLTGAEMRAAERAAFARGLPSFEAMRRAGVAVADAIMARWPVYGSGEVHVLCGPGNNGGDGFIVAETLRGAGYRVLAHAVRAKSNYAGDAARAASLWQGDVRTPDRATFAALDRSAIVVDALFGIGLDRALEGETAALNEAVNASPATVVAVDIASGVHADDGRAMGVAIDADLTVTFNWRKRGHVLQPGAGKCGETLVADVGFGAADLSAANPACWLNAPALWSSAYPLPQPSDHKYQRGHAIIVGGGVMTGAARLAARAARRVGIGLLTMAVPPEAWPIYAGDLPGAIVRPVADLAAFAAIAGDERISALLVGSGLEPDAHTGDLVRTCIAFGRPMVIDGGGLTVLAGSDALVGGHAEIVLTPHEGEFGRLFPDLVARASKIERAVQAARRTGCIIVLKGSDTVIAAPDGGTIISGCAPPTLATAGSGDVLAGIITGLLGLHLPPFLAASMGVWLHVRAAEGFGIGLIAEDLPDRLPAALAKALGRKG
ncbi:NAD(P)H-hydrate dehydratase [Dongia deserti]|uniref:NAD(P)H-hydrate dehydratase n=1 Tax=Dongia deserti TaxID=2268030 RepID=UPI000E64CF04|nr:NAD(P)H-hydrate dehydratase [Dongia deserti]